MFDELRSGQDETRTGEDETRTGNDAVDAVLQSLQGVEDLPLEEQVTLFERAHEQLRGALDGPRET